MTTVDNLARLATVSGNTMSFALPEINARLCGWYYFVGADQLDVIRLLADAQDLLSILTDSE